jgi:hypothetical protein
MKTLSQPAVITPAIIGLAILFAAITFIGVDIILLVVIGMTICSQGGIGRVAATGEWTHPLSIVGYLYGGLILLITLAVFVGWKLPYIQNDQQALLAIAVLACIKVANAVIHYWLARA